MRVRWRGAMVLGAVLVLAACSSGGTSSPSASGRSTPAKTTAPAAVAVSHVGMNKIKHVIVVMEENRSFDSFFGTCPGADGLTMANGQPAECIPSGDGGACAHPYVDH